MNKMTYQNMYKHIKLTGDQRSEILQSLSEQTISKQESRHRFSYYVAIVFCVISLSGITVYASKYFDVATRMEEAFEELLGKELDVTEEQKQVYTDYSTILGDTIDLGYGKLELEAVLYDSRYLYIPFTISDIDSNFSRERLQDITFELKNKEERNIIQYGYMKEINNEGNVIKGNFIVIFQDDIFEKGDSIQVWSKEKDSLLSEFELSNDIGEQVVKVEVDQALSSDGIKLAKVIISPLSLYVQGTYSDNPITHSSLAVKLKDGTIVNVASTGPSSGFGDNRETGEKEFFAQTLFETPINIDEVESILLDTGSQEIAIPFNK